MRILITGSRTWTDYITIEEAFSHCMKVYTAERGRWGNVVVVSGACPTGADAICESIAFRLGCEIERHPADWKTHGKSAGFKRNAEMVALGADVCLAFIKDGSKGATHTANLAEKSGIMTVRYE